MHTVSPENLVELAILTYEAENEGLYQFYLHDLIEVNLLTSDIFIIFSWGRGD